MVYMKEVFLPVAEFELYFCRGVSTDLATMQKLFQEEGIACPWVIY